MGHNRDWLPGSRTEQLAMARNWIILMIENKTAWGIPQAVITELDRLHGNANVALTRAMASERNAVTNQEVRTAFGALADYMRDVRRRHFFMPPLTEANWVALGMRLPDTVPTTIGDPTSVVAAEIGYPHKNSLSLHVIPIEGHRYDERAEWGFRIYFGVLPHGTDVSQDMAIERQYLFRTPENPEELRESHFTRRRRDVIEFPYDNSGMKCFVCVRYENGKGGKGPWGPMVSSFIP